jgi:Holliday junction resolvase RusA-like endonuclease
MKIIIGLPPITKKNSQQIHVNRKTGARFIAPSEKYKQYENDAGFFFFHSGDYLGKYPVNVKCLFYMPTRRRVDLVNLLESVDDLLTHYGIIPDDSAQYIGGHDGSRVLYDKDKPRTEIYIETLPD